MKFLKSIALGIFLATSTVGISSVAEAADAGRISFAPAAAIKMVQDQLSVVEEAIAGGISGKEVARLIKDARDLSKEINANDKVDIARGRANGHLKQAQKAAKKDDLKAASEHVKVAVKGYSTLASLL